MSKRYALKQLGNSIRVVDIEADCVDGYWNQTEKEWFDVREFIQ
jgi:hypothetical protein